jgi:hypothetical protein
MERLGREFSIWLRVDVEYECELDGECELLVPWLEKDVLRECTDDSSCDSDCDCESDLFNFFSFNYEECQ